MKTLVIHPKDKTTDFLSTIYDGKNWTVITDNPSNKDLKILIKNHDRIIMLGHGTQYGLIGHKRLIIDSTLVYLLRDKVTVCIWCNADQFVKKYDLKGLYTGMIISEYDEAIYWAIHSPKSQDILDSNNLFATAISKVVDLDCNIVDSVLEVYKGDNNPIIHFNKNNIYFKS
jgi:hypothetical protein